MAGTEFSELLVYISIKKKNEKTHDRLNYGCAIFMKNK